MPVPPAAPPRPGVSPPAGDMASKPVVALGGTPIFVPGWLDITVPDSFPLPPLTGGVGAAPVSRGAPRPGPLRPVPEPRPFGSPLTDGGGGGTFWARSLPPVPAAPPVVPAPPPGPPTVGGGGTTLGFPTYGARARAEFPVPPDRPTDGGGATAFEPRVT